jgi:hypothetical protein
VTRRGVLAILAFAAVLSSGLPAVADHFVPIQPGGQVLMPDGGSCTLNFVFEDPAGGRYIGTAGHCVQHLSLGARLSVRDLGEFGTLVYVSFHEDPLDWNDFALIRIDEDKVPSSSAAMRGWGGPLGAEDAFLPGTPTVFYGQATLLGDTEPTRALRAGVLQEVTASAPMRDWFIASNPSWAGDSGSGMLTARGTALGVIVGGAMVANQGGAKGPTIHKVLAELQGSGFDVALKTAPFELPAAAEQLALGMLGHCIVEPMGPPGDPDSCVRQPF